MGNLCGIAGYQVLPAFSRLYRFLLRDARTGVLLEQVSICDDRLSEQVPAGFVYDPSTEELETE